MATPNVGDIGGVNNTSLFNSSKKLKQQEEQAGSFGPNGTNFLQVITEKFANVNAAVPSTVDGYNSSMI